MARIVLGSYLVQFPLGGYLSWVLQWLVGFKQLGHDVYFVEKAGGPNSCFDPLQKIMTNDCSYGTKVLDNLLAQFNLQDKWCFVDAPGQFHGLSRKQIEEVFSSADVFIDMGTHGAWLEEATNSILRVLIDGEPGTTQMKMATKLQSGQLLDNYDYYYSVGRNIGTEASNTPSAGLFWRHIFYPVIVDLFPHRPVRVDAPFTTVMSWQAHEPITFNGVTYGQKDIEFQKYFELPTKTKVKLEIAVAGKDLPERKLKHFGWSLRNSIAVTISFDSWCNYILASRGEFSVCKNVFVAKNTGWFSDRSAVYLACGRPVVMQETGFSAHLPTGEGLFAVNNVDEAAAALDTIQRNYKQHSTLAREVAWEYLDGSKVLKKFLNEVGI